MSTILADIRAKLVAQTSVTDLVGTRIYPTVAEQGATAPFAVLTLVSEQPENTLSGKASTRLMRCSVQVDTYAKMHDAAREAADAIDAVLSDLSGPELSAWRISATDSYDDGPPLHRVMMEYEVFR